MTYERGALEEYEAVRTSGITFARACKAGSGMTLTDVRAMLEQRAAEADAQRATAPLGDTLRWVLGELATVNGDNGNGHGKAAEPDRLLTAREVADRLRVKPWFVYAHRKALGGVSVSPRVTRFPESAVTRYLARR